jgi:ankyrin repeat protein/nucleoside phosphorylase
VQEYAVGWLCALPIELAAAQMQLDALHIGQAHDPNDETRYILGNMENHNIVIGCLSAGELGTSSAATVATKMHAKFPNLRFILMVGVGGGVPTTKDVRLGDVVVSQPSAGYGGVVQYDFGKSVPGRFIHTGCLNAPPQALLQALSHLQARHLCGDNSLSKYLAVSEKEIAFRRPNPESDILFKATYDHIEGDQTCGQCDMSETVDREPREHNHVVFHYGTIASGNRVLKNARERDLTSTQFGGVLCFEMEAGGLMNTFPCLVIRGISDYADSHKNKVWQPYAASAAAACAKEILSMIPAAKMAQNALFLIQPTNKHVEQPITKQTDKFLTNEYIETVKSCLMSLYFSELEDRLQNIRDSLPETCNWLFEDPTYSHWYKRQNLENHHGLLWIKGKPGSGKSTLVKQAYHRAQQQLAASSTTVAAFFFNARGTDLEKSQLGLFRSLLYQILLQDYRLLAKRLKETYIADPTKEQDLCLELQSFPLLAEIVQRFKENESTPGKTGRWEWHVNELKLLFKRAFLKTNGRRTIIFVDALDECNEKDIRDLAHCFRAVTDAAYVVGSDLIICLSSRHYPTISVPHYEEIIVEHGNRDDIARYVQVKLGQFSHDDNRVSLLGQEIIQEASGIFLWVALVIEILSAAIENGKSTRDVWRSVPQSLEDLFSCLLKTLGPSDRIETVKLVQWVLLANRPLNPEKLCIAMAFTSKTCFTSLRDWKKSDYYVKSYQQMVRWIRSSSRGLVEVTNNAVQFIHESVQELFMRGNGFSILCNSPVPRAIGEGHYSIAEACLNLISVSELKSLYWARNEDAPKRLSQLENLGWDSQNPGMEVGSKDTSMFEYGVSQLFYHLGRAEDDGLVLHHLVDRMRSSGEYLWKLWKQLHLVTRDEETGVAKGQDVSLLYAFCIKEFISCAIHLLESGIDPNEAGISAQYPIIAAVQGLRSPVKMVEVLVQKRADVNVKDKNGWTALHMAARCGNQAVARLLLRHRAHTNAKTHDGESAISIAVKNDQEAIVRLLEEYDVKIDLGDHHIQTMLLQAAKYGRDLQMRLLLDRKAKVYVKSPDRQNRLHRDTGNRCEVVMRPLLEHQLNNDLKDEEGLTALPWAVCRGNELAVRLLLKHDFSINTALHQAAEWGCEAMARLLLEHGVNINEKDGKGMTPLHWAITRSDELLTGLLLEFQADVNAKTDYGDTALHLLVEGWNEGVARMLLAHGANINEKDAGGRSVLHCATMLGHKAAARLLLEHKADANAKDQQEMTALHRAARCCDEAMARLLLEYGANINTKDLSGQTALHPAAERHGTVVRLLLEHNAKVSERDSEGRTALHLASETGHEEAVGLLLKHGANIDVADNYGHTPLSGAIRWRKNEVVRLLERSCLE